MSNPLKEKVRDFILDLTRSTCKDTTALISEMMDHNVSLTRRWRIKFHVTLCEYCRYYQAQLETLRNLSQGLEKKAPDMESQGSLKEDAKVMMKKLIDDSK